jgi:hypothetical protein
MDRNIFRCHRRARATRVPTATRIRAFTCHLLLTLGTMNGRSALLFHADFHIGNPGTFFSVGTAFTVVTEPAIN